MKTEKMTYEKPTVQKVEFDFKTRIAASGCRDDAALEIVGSQYCNA